MCFSLWSIRELLIWLVVVCAVVALIRIFIGNLIPGVPPVVVAVLNVILWAVVAIAVIVIVFDLLACLLVGVPRIH